MRMTVLVENEACAQQLGAEHGLSFYIESQGQTFLFDMGKGDLFLKNAEMLGCPIDAVELAAVSHGHYDHGGGLGAFLEANSRAPVYIRKSAFEPHLSLRKNGETVDIGLDNALQYSGRIVFTGEHENPTDGVTLFSGVTERVLFSGCNDTILMKKNGSIVPDDFVHEQSMILCNGDKTALIAGCAHSGIVNILRRAEKLLGRMPDVVIGGFHLNSPSLGRNEPEERIRAIGEILGASGSVFYTGHCTGGEAFALLKDMLGERLHEMHAGTVIEI